MKAYTIPERYTPAQLVELHRRCRAEEMVLRVRGFAGQVFTSATWLMWFFDKLTEKINRHEPERGNGNAARRRVNAHKDRVAECKWCGRKTGKQNRRFCDVSCQQSWNS